MKKKELEATIEAWRKRYDEDREIWKNDAEFAWQVVAQQNEELELQDEKLAEATEALQKASRGLRLAYELEHVAQDQNMARVAQEEDALWQRAAVIAEFAPSPAVAEEARRIMLALEKRWAQEDGLIDEQDDSQDDERPAIEWRRVIS